MFWRLKVNNESEWLERDQGKREDGSTSQSLTVSSTLVCASQVNGQPHMFFSHLGLRIFLSSLLEMRLDWFLFVAPFFGGGSGTCSHGSVFAFQSFSHIIY